LVLIAIYIGLMFLGQWIAASAFERARVDGASSTPSPPVKTWRNAPINDGR
jgi:hypothetical protein